MDKIESLQNHPKDEIHEKAVKILETFFGFEDEEDQNLAPAVSRVATPRVSRRVSLWEARYVSEAYGQGVAALHPLALPAELQHTSENALTGVSPRLPIATRRTGGWSG